MYWQKRFDKENPDKEIEEQILEIRSEHKDFGYRRICGELIKLGFNINKKKVQRLVQKLSLQVKSYTKKVENTHPTKVLLVELRKIEWIEDLIQV